MVFPHCFTHYILYEKLRNFFKETIFHEFSSCPYRPLNKVMRFNVFVVLPKFSFTASETMGDYYL